MTAPRLDHIAIAMPRIAEATPVLTGVLGGVPIRPQPSGVFAWATWTFAGGGAIEVLEPRGDDGFLHRFLASRGRGIHHVTFIVPSLTDVCERAQREGFDVVGRDETDPLWKEAFLHPRQALGIVVQFAETSAPKPPAEPPPLVAPPPVTVVGLRLRARTRDRARRLWEQVIGGSSENGPCGEPIYRWPGSPMRLAIDVDPDGEEGPIAIEIAADGRDLALPAGRHPILGAVVARAR